MMTKHVADELIDMYIFIYYSEKEANVRRLLSFLFINLFRKSYFIFQKKK